MCFYTSNLNGFLIRVCALHVDVLWMQREYDRVISTGN